jgi:hypothetical protein
VLRSFLVTVAVISMLSAAGCAPDSNASPTPDASNIGFVMYTRGDAPGTLKARWMYTTAYSGPGLATGGPTAGFAGQYHIRYFLESGEFSDEYDLVIQKSGNLYDVSWLADGKVKAVGVGMEVENGLAVGWHKVAD